MNAENKEKDRVDLSVVLTAHSETVVSGPTMLSVDAAVSDARAAGFSVEQIILLDNATDETNAYFGQTAFDHWTRLVVTEGDLGLARNAAVPMTNGAFIAFVDADDLVSRNWFSEGCRRLQLAEESGHKVIAHPELNWIFDGAKSVYYKPDQSDPLWTPWYLYAMNYYDSMCMAPRQAHIDCAYASRDIPNGLSFQDWQFSVETIDQGWHHASVRDTIVFKRRRANSLVTESRARKAIIRDLPSMKIDRIASLGASKQISSDPVPPPLPDQGVPHSGEQLETMVADANKVAVSSWRRFLPGYKRVHKALDYHYALAVYPRLSKLFLRDPVIYQLVSGLKIALGRKDTRRPAIYFGPKEYAARHARKLFPLGPFHRFLRCRKEEITAPFERFEDMAGIIGIAPLVAQSQTQHRYDELRSRLRHGTLGQMVTDACQLDPLIGLAWPNAYDVKIPPFHTDLVVNRVTAIYAAQKAADFKRAKVAIVVNRPRWGGGRRLEGHIAHALADSVQAEKIVVVSTDDEGKMPEDRFPDGVRHIDFHRTVGNLSRPERERALVFFLRSLDADIVFNINSRLLWDALGPYGKALKASTKIVGCFFCAEKNRFGHWSGYPLSQVSRTFHLLSAICTDSASLAQDIIHRHQLSDAYKKKITVLSAPMPEGVPVTKPNGAKGRPQVFWAGRFDAQKRVDMTFKIAKLLPDVTFRLWGETVMGGADVTNPPSNVLLEGKFQNFRDLPISDADLWLYTSAWDGVPSILLEVAAAGVPLVGTNVGGTGEVLNPELSHSIPDEAGPSIYAEAIRTVLSDPQGHGERALELRDNLIDVRTEQTFKQSVFNLCAQAGVDLG